MNTFQFKKQTKDLEELMLQIERYGTWPTAGEFTIVKAKLRKFIDSLMMQWMEDDEDTDGITKLENDAYNGALESLGDTLQGLMKYVDERK